MKMKSIYIYINEQNSLPITTVNMLFLVHDKPIVLDCINLNELTWKTPIFGLTIPQVPRANCIISWGNPYNDFINVNHMNLIFLYDLKIGLGPPNVEWILLYIYNDEWNDG